ncbi:hypothetical protein [Megasphaera massiliensis]|uniref:hypothetical protein n=1 Tax=Megasphaera massiliensis TaxID=1232428 RepID=UPI0012B5FA8E|nr:hypothetical protein [Megasphaera massiliensis]
MKQLACGRKCDRTNVAAFGWRGLKQRIRSDTEKSIILMGGAFFVLKIRAHPHTELRPYYPYQPPSKIRQKNNLKLNEFI